MFYKKIYKYSFFIVLIFHQNLTMANQSILYIDMNYLLNNSLAGKSIVSQLKNINETNLKNFKKIEEGLKSEESKLISQQKILEKDEYLNQLNDLKKKVSNYKLERSNIINNTLKKKESAQKKLLNELDPILKDYAKKNSVLYIMRKKNIIIGNTELDITQIILKSLDSNIKKINIK
jgi:Skp family chaperone for outer membrane proteins